MDVDAQLAPPVVAVLVVHEPGDWFDEALASLAAQDYPNLRVLALVAGDDASSTRVTAAIPTAFVRSVAGNPGFGRTANEVLRLVEGESGFFCFLHDDVALDPGAIRLMVEELYRSNAGIVGPKLVDWDDPEVLQHVGLAVDHTAAIDPLIEPGERDQEQHDAVRDVFALSSACMLIRADLFRSLGGFDPAIEYHGDSLDLCWRAHLSGARVVVVPSSRGRHREELDVRRPDLDHRAMRARNRMRAFATLSGGWRLLGRVPQLIFTTLAELVTGIFTGRGAEGRASMMAMLGLLPRFGSIMRRRSMIKPLRIVPDREISELQIRGSARRIAHRRSQEFGGRNSRSEWGSRLPEQGSTPIVFGWLAVIALVLIGSRAIIGQGSHAVGQMLPFPSGAGDLLHTYRSGWWNTGLGETAAQPTAFGIIALAGTAVFGRMGLLHTLGIVGPLVLGLVGIWRLTSVLGTSRARMASVVAYASVGLPYAATGTGRWGVLATYALVPWAMHAVRRISGWAVPGVVAEDPDVIDLIAVPTVSERIRLSAGLVLALALGLAFAPGTVLVVVVCAVVWLLATALVRGSVVAAAIGVAASVVGAVGAFVLDLPWSIGLLGGDAAGSITGPTLASPPDIGLLDLASFRIGPAPLGVAALALYATVLVSVVVADGWRLGWAARGASLVVVFLALAALDDGGSLPVRLPEAGILLVPVAVGLAITAGCTVAALGQDVLGARFGIRQPLGLLGVVAISVATLSGLGSVVNGRFGQPGFTLDEQLSVVLPADPVEGDYRTLFLGDPRVIPAAALEHADGIAYSLVDDGGLDVTDDWIAESETQQRLISGALDALAERDTARVGRALAPLAVRYVVIPLRDGVDSTSEAPIEAPIGLVGALDDQLDLRRVYSPTDIIVYENTAWIPTRSVLDPAAATASEQGGLDALVRTDLSGSTPVMVGAEATDAVEAELPAGTFHLAVPVDERWHLSIDGADVPGRPAFGYSTAYDLGEPSSVVLEYRTDMSRTLWVALQLGFWVITILGTTRFFTRLRLRSTGGSALADAAPVITLDEPIADPALVQVVPGLGEPASDEEVES